MAKINDWKQLCDALSKHGVEVTSVRDLKWSNQKSGSRALSGRRRASLNSF